MPARLTKEAFIERAIDRYGSDRFDYSNVVYHNSKTNVDIRCGRCDLVFSIRPVTHLNASTEVGGCPSCLLNFRQTVHAENMRDKYTSTRDEFIARANKKWDYAYDYAHVRYVNSRTKVRVVCKKHKIEYLVTPGNHLIKPGCPQCKSDSIRDSQSFSQSDFEAICNQVHGNKYEYGEYFGAHEKIKIKCEIHGWFEQIARVHRNGSIWPPMRLQVSRSKACFRS